MAKDPNFSLNDDGITAPGIRALLSDERYR